MYCTICGANNANECDCEEHIDEVLTEEEIHETNALRAVMCTCKSWMLNSKGVLIKVADCVCEGSY